MRSTNITIVLTIIIGIICLLRIDNVNATFPHPISTFARRRLSSDDAALACGVITQDVAGKPAPGSAILHYSDGRTIQIGEGNLVETSMIGAIFCPCMHIPSAGIAAPVAGIWNYSVPIPAGAISPSAGTFCAVPAGNHFNNNNICKNPADFNPNSIYDESSNSTCGNLAYMCSTLKPLGGLASTYKSYLRNFVPRCCNGKMEYNDNSGCGPLESESDICNGGEFDGDAIMHSECKSPDGDSCDGPCTTSADACIAARGQQHIKYGRPFSMNLEFVSYTCGSFASSTCATSLVSVPEGDPGAPPEAWRVKASFPCKGTREDGSEVTCVDSLCQQSEEQCLLRRGQTSPTGEKYPDTMAYTKAGNLFEDIMAYNAYSNHHMGVKMSMSKCCKTGGYTDACARPEFKEVMNKYSLCKNPGEFNAKNKISDYYNCTIAESCSQNIASLKSKAGVCMNSYGDKEWLVDSESHCSDRFRKITYADIVESSLGLLSASSSCCNDGIINDGCDFGRDLYVERPSSINLCKDMSMFKRDGSLYGATCSQHNFIISSAMLFDKGKCGTYENGVIQVKCTTNGCKVSKEICELAGYNYQPHDENYIKSQNQHVVNTLGATCCGTAENTNEIYSSFHFIKPGSPPANTPGDCTGGNCCGEGTRWQDGTGCVPTRRGIIDACKKKRGKWGWTCEEESVCAL